MSCKVLQNGDVYNQLHDMLPNATLIILDGSYAVLKKSVMVDFAAELHADLKAGKVPGWKEQYDCDDYSVAAWHMAKRKHWLAVMQGRTDAQAPTLGLLMYNQGAVAGQGHCVNIVCTGDGWQAWEPQTQRFFRLTNSEKESAWYAIL